MVSMRQGSARGTEIALLLLAINCLNMIDRSLLFILAEAIKIDLDLSDKQIGLLGGVVFAVVYSFSSLPFGRLTDRGFARSVMGGAVAVWSIMTALGGLTQNFLQLAIARFGVASAEAAAAPSAHSIIAEQYPVERRAMMISIYSLGVPLGTMMGLILGGWLVDHFSWRQAFFVVGLPGLCMAIIAYLRLPPSKLLQGSHDLMGTVQTVRYLFSLSTFRRTVVASSLYSFGGYALLAFLPAFMMRSHGLSAGQAGLWLGLVTGCSGLIGMPASGFLADRLSVKDPGWRLRIPAILMGVSAPFLLAAMLVDNWIMALVLLFIPQMLMMAFLGPTFSAMHMIVPPHMRATATSCLLGTLTLIGASLGPLAVGAISDLLQPDYGAHALGMAMLILPVLLLLSCWQYLIAAKRLPGDLYEGKEG